MSTKNRLERNIPEESAGGDPADLFMEEFDEKIETNPDGALVLLNDAIRNELIDPTVEGDHMQDRLMHIYADIENWKKVEEIIAQTVRADSQKGRILFYEENSGKQYDGLKVPEKNLKDYSPDEIETHKIFDYVSCVKAIRMEKFEDVERFMQGLIDQVDNLGRELMDKLIELEDFTKAKEVVEKYTDNQDNKKGRERHLANLARKPYEKI